ncbi:MAG: DUF4230 domain-containing protein [Bacteroidia bacterium]|nr:DUF4230 domain-containing protein [Bacteroidia bacterium]
MEENPQSTPAPEGATPTESAAAQEVMWRRIAKEFRKEIARESRDDDDDFDDEANAIAIGIIVLGLLVGAFFLIRPFFRDKPVDPVYTKLEAIKHIQDLTLVKQHYTSLIPVTQKPKNDKDEPPLEFLLRAPVQVYGNIDMSQVDFIVEDDSLITVILPRPSIDRPYLDLGETEVFSAGKALFQKLSSRLFAKNVRYLDAYDQITAAMEKASDDVYARALTNDIEKETLDQAEIYLRSLIGSLGYRVRFERPVDLPDPADSTGWRALQQQLTNIDMSAPEIPSQRGIIRRLLTN